MFRTCAVVVLVSIPVSGCAVGTCTDPTDAALAALPSRLSETGRFDAGVIEYAPAFALWSDGAEKHRAIALPPGTQIDTSDMDDWRFPKGTRLWKDFVRDGVLVETRFLIHYGDADDAWASAAYVWNGEDAELSLEGATNANGTPHDVPAAGKCHGCHGGRASYVLGFSAVQLANADPSNFDLDDAITRGLLSAPPSDAAALRVPGTQIERAALGYLHTNCSHCHNQSRPRTAGPRCYDPRQEFDFLLRAAELADVSQTATYRTALIDPDVLIRGKPEQSPLLTRMKARARSERMPPLATENVDEEAVDAIRAWVEGL
ncbi:MAG: hypothetical protein JNM17_14630 [Archangium sp.]|nr:hypothetical protein [Archangium sp.]